MASPQEGSSGSKRLPLGPAKVKVEKTFVEYVSEDSQGGNTPAGGSAGTKTCPVFRQRDIDDDDDMAGGGLPSESRSQPGGMNRSQASEGQSTPASQARSLPDAQAAVKVRNTFIEFDDGEGSPSVFDSATKTCPVFGGIGEGRFDSEASEGGERPPPGLEGLEGSNQQAPLSQLPVAPQKVSVKKTFIEFTSEASEDDPTKSMPMAHSGYNTMPVTTFRRNELEEEPPPGLEGHSQSGKSDKSGGRSDGERQEVEGPHQEPSMSRGSALHDVGRCEPCAWYWKPGGCRSGPKCRRCHMCPNGELKARRKVKNSMLREWKHTSTAAPGMPGAMPGMPGMMPGMGGIPPDVTGFKDPSMVDEPDGDVGIGVITQEVVGLRPHATIKPEDLEVENAFQREMASNMNMMGFDWDAAATAGMPPMMPPFMPGMPGMEMPDQRNSGSVLHWVGRCEPCAWFWRPGGCKSGQECRRCHLCPPGEAKVRKKAKNKALHNILAKMAEAGVDADA